MRGSSTPPTPCRRATAVKTIPIPGTSQQTTTYPIATLDQSKQADLAQHFVDLVMSSQGQQVLQDAGFGAP